MLRVRFAPSPTGYLHIGSARTFIFNWLYARHNQGVMILRIDDTDVERNTQTSLDSIFDGLKWLDLGWDEFYRQSERLDLHRKLANEILAKGLAYRDFTPLEVETEEKNHMEGHWISHPAMRELSREESDRRAAAGEPFVVRYRVPRESREAVTFTDLVYGEQSKATADIEDFALLRSNTLPTYHMASCADDADLRISHIIRGQDHLTNTFKHVLIFEALGVNPPQFAHLPLVDCARWLEAVETQARPGGQRHHLSRRRLPAAHLRQFPVPAGLVAEKRSRSDVAPGTDRRVHARRSEPFQRHREFHGRRSLRSQGRVAECRASPRACRWKNCQRCCCPSRSAAGFDADACENAGHHAADPRTHPHPA